MIKVEDKKKCCGCGACINICPKSCIVMNSNSEGFLYPKVNLSVCINCGMCENVCPEVNTPILHDEINQAFACRSIDEEIRNNSSSGGVFFLLSQLILSKGGVVVAPVFNESYRVQHSIIENEQQLIKAIGSKYVQSDTGIIYKEIKTLLESDRMVLFSGTPCQITGLKNYLGKNYKHLITQDIICHGVPSPMVWEKHLNYLGIKKNNVKSIKFREKSNGWRAYSLRVNYEDGRDYCEPSYKEPYLRMFARNLTLRPSCFSCPFKGKERTSDLTLGDFWGIEKVCPEMNDNKGTSLVIVHSHQGFQVLNALREKLIIVAVDIDEALKYNGAALKPATAATNREQFFEDIIENEYEDVIAQYCADSLFIKAKRIIKRLIHR